MTGSDVAPLSEQEGLLYRQAHPSWLQAERISSQAFRPTAKDDGRLSVDRSTLVTAEESYARFLADGHESAGVWAVSVKECATVGLAAYPDQRPNNDAHAYIDFTGLGANAVKRKGKKLAAKARSRGIQYSPAMSTADPNA